MSASTLPKSVQAQSANAAANDATSSQDRTQYIGEFVEKYRQLPDDFLRVAAAYYPSQELSTVPHQPRNMLPNQGPLVDMLDISVVEAQLVKNYGLLRMDLYCKIRVGHMVCETQTCPNGAKNPKWDGVYQFTLKPGIDSFHLEIYDEKQFSLDEKIAWLYEPIPTEVFQGITVERWFPLSGRLGTNKEGSILLVLSHKRVPMRSSHFGRSIMPHQHGGGAPLTVFVPAGNHPTPVIGGPTVVPVDPQVQIPGYIQPPTNINQQAGRIAEQQLATAEQPQASEEDVNQLSEMFPSIDKAIIKAILENNQNDKEAAIGALLAMG